MTATKSQRLKTEYAVTLTGEQIKLIRSLSLRMEQTWLRSGVGVYVCKDGTVERVPMFECCYCKQGTFEGAATIQHKQDCIIPLSNAEWEKMNAEFIRAETAD